MGQHTLIVDEFTDDYSDSRRPGRVIGSLVRSGIVRRGVDKENAVGIDNGALRIRTLIKPGWGRAGIAYGPYGRCNGLAFGVSILNGHNTSQTGELPEGSVRGRLKRWALGSETDSPLVRLLRLARGTQRRYMWRRLSQWWVAESSLVKRRTVDQNLALGWFPSEVPSNPLEQGNAFIMHALGPECGELWVRVDSGTLRSVRGLQNIQMYYVVVLREQGAAYYAASIPGVPGLDPYPTMTPLAIDAFAREPAVYAGVHQSVLGQIGFRVDTRVYRTQVAKLPNYGQWFGSASAADRLTGEGALPMTEAATGGSWSVWYGDFRRTARGLIATTVPAGAAIELPKPAGLVHLILEVGERAVEGFALLFRIKDRNNFFAFELGTEQCAFSIMLDGVQCRFPGTREHCLGPQGPNSVQIYDDGETIRLYLNGGLVYGTHLWETRLSEGLGVGLRSCGEAQSVVLRDFEAHPRHVPLPQPLDLGEPWHAQGCRIVIDDRFEGEPGDLAHHSTPCGRTWRRDIGRGELQVAGKGVAKVRGSVQDPSPDRTAYTLEWDNPGFADVSVEITPPGTRKGAGERGRGGIIFWQDKRNYITVSAFIDDWYGTSIAAFFYRDGFEELYDAVWTNLGRRVQWGMPYSFRVAFDATRYTAYVNDEPVLHRALCDIYPDWNELRINRLGLVSNWEWGTDTGTIFKAFVARDLR